MTHAQHDSQTEVESYRDLGSGCFACNQRFVGRHVPKIGQRYSVNSCFVTDTMDMRSEFVLQHVVGTWDHVLQQKLVQTSPKLSPNDEEAFSTHLLDTLCRDDVVQTDQLV